MGMLTWGQICLRIFEQFEKSLLKNTGTDAVVCCWVTLTMFDICQMISK